MSHHMATATQTKDGDGTTRGSTRAACDRDAGRALGRGLCALALIFSVGASACAATSAQGPIRALCLGDEDLPLGTPLVFAHEGYQHMARVPLPDGPHRVRRLWVMAAAAGTLEVTLYTEGDLQGPAEKAFSTTVNVGPGDVSHGSHGPWFLVDLPELAPFNQAVWVGFRKKEGQPALWSTGAGSRLGGYLRSVDPHDPLEILPLRHGPVFRLEVQP